MKLSLLSFATRGEQGSLPLQACEHVFIKTFSPYVDSLKVYHLDDLQKDEWWVNNYNKTQGFDPFKYGVFGFWKYKALILFRELQNTEDGTVVMYSDIDHKKRPDILYDAENVKKTCEYVLDKAKTDIWLCKEGNNVYVKNWCQFLTVQKLSPCNYWEILDKPLLLCSRIIVRNTPEIRGWFEKTVLPAFEDDSLMYETNVRHAEYANYTGDQCIWNALLYDRYIKDSCWPYLVHDKDCRKFSISTMFESDFFKCRNDMIMHYTSKIENPIILDLGSGSVDETYDIIYLDGNEDTEKDLDVAFKKIKNGGYIIGHNYILNFSKTYNKKDFTVKKIVEKFCEENGQRILAQAMDARVSYCIKITKH
jgi:hypothetical protein